MFDVILLGCEQIGGVVVDGDGSDFVALFDGIDDVLAIGDLAEDRVFAVEVGGGTMGYEELRAVGSGAGVGHREHAG